MECPHADVGGRFVSPLVVSIRLLALENRMGSKHRMKRGIIDGQYDMMVHICSLRSSQGWVGWLFLPRVLTLQTPVSQTTNVFGANT